jgi:hypothetical protein
MSFLPILLHAIEKMLKLENRIKRKHGLVAFLKTYC